MRMRTIAAGAAVAALTAVSAPTAFAGSPAAVPVPVDQGARGLTDDQGLAVKDSSHKRTYLHLSKNAGHRGDAVQVEARCADGRDADLDSLALDDVKPMHADENGVMQVTTHVEKKVKPGRYRVQVICKDGERPRETFTVKK